MERTLETPEDVDREHFQRLIDLIRLSRTGLLRSHYAPHLYLEVVAKLHLWTTQETERLLEENPCKLS